MELKIRNFHPSDLCMLYAICLQTGNSGSDASDMYQDKYLLGHYYAGPYAVLEPELCFVLTCGGKPCGYILGTKHSAAFADYCEDTWFPVLREQYPMPEAEDDTPDASIIRRLHAGHQVSAAFSAYPAHLHIDLLPAAQGQGMGRALMQTFLAKLRDLEVPAVHLQVGKKNPGAIQFYQRTGFHLIEEQEKALAFGMKLQ